MWRYPIILNQITVRNVQSCLARQWQFSETRLLLISAVPLKQNISPFFTSTTKHFNNSSGLFVDSFNIDIGFHRRSLRSSVVLFSDTTVVVCPAFAESISEGDIRWNKSVGDAVSADEVICEIETDKTTVPVPSPISGVITELLAEDGSTVKHGDELVKIKPGGESASSAKTVAASSPKEEPTVDKNVPVPESIESVPIPESRPDIPPLPTEPMKTIPIAETKLPRPSMLPGSKPGPVPIVRLPPADPTKEIAGTRSEFRVKMNRMRLKIASRLKEAQNTNAMLTTFNELDMSGIMKLRKDNQDAFIKKHGIKLGFMSAFVKASAYALSKQPTVNAVIEDGEIIYRDFIDISVAVATPKGLVVPVLRNVQDQNYAQIELEIAALGEKAKNNQLSMEDMDGGTFTISNGGVFGSLFGTPIINPPQSAILGMHGTFERPVVRNGQIVIRPMMYIALTYDHRLIDGREAVTFLRSVKGAVEDPSTMLLDL